MKLLYWLLAVPLSVVAVLFAVSNRGVVELGLWPLPDTVPTPAFLVAFGGLAIGFLAGGLVAWWGAGRTRARARAAERAVRTRDIEIEDLRSKATQAEREATARKTGPPAPAGLPAPAEAKSG